MNGIILAGGQSTRMGRDKAALPWRQDGDMLHAVARALVPVRRRLIVVSNTPRALRFPAQVVPDNFPGAGPLAGLEAGLAASDRELNFFAPCDMPFLTAQVVRHLAGYAAGFDVVVPRADGYLQPLCGCYRRTCLPFIRRLLAMEQRRVSALYPLVRLRLVEGEELAACDKELHFLVNINDPGQYAAWHKPGEGQEE